MDQAARVKQLDNLLTLYGMCLEIDDAHSPWPDEDGGEMRVLVCLRAVLPHLDADGLTKAEQALLGELD